MGKKELTFAEIKENQESFLQQYAVAEIFPQCGVSWKTLMEIGDDYETKCYGKGREKQEYEGEYFDIIQSYLSKVATFKDVHSYRYRIKKTGSLLAKIIRKGNERHISFDVDNYYQKITDLLGLRILYVFKEDYWSVNQQIMTEYENKLAQHICVKLKKGDDEEIYKRLCQEYSNVHKETDETYRSIHYTLYSRDPESDPRLEIQTRTIFEEGWSEINHKLVYKKGAGNSGLKKTSDVLSSMVGACDTIGMLMKTLYDTGVDLNDDKKASRNGSSTGEDSVVEVIRNFLRQ